MRTRAYGDVERAIASADTNGIRERWLYGLRLIHDEDAIASGGGLKHGVAEQLVEAARRRGVKISEREIRYRMQVARAYPKESQIGTVCADFATWSDLRSANFPPIEADPDEPLADWRTAAEKKSARAHQMAEEANENQLALFPAERFELDAPLKDLVAYAEEQAELTARFAARDRERGEYLERLLAAVEGDESVSWRDAHVAAFGAEPDDEGGEES